MVGYSCSHARLLRKIFQAGEMPQILIKKEIMAKFVGFSQRNRSGGGEYIREDVV